MGTFRNRWRKLAASKKYRESFVAAQAKQVIPFQIRALMKAQGLSQQRLAEQAGLTQGAVSRAASPSYGNLSLNTLFRIAAGFDVAFVGRFVPFSELDRWLDHLNEESADIPDFGVENEYSETLFATFDHQFGEADFRKAIAEARTTRLLPYLERARKDEVPAAAQLNLLRADVIGHIVPQARSVPTNITEKQAPIMELYGQRA